jgi:hypothetical protein
MAVIPLTGYYSLKNAILTIATDDYTAAISQIQFDPSVSPTVWRGIGGNVIKDTPVADWTATLAHAQDTANGSLTRYLLANAGQTKAVVFTPVNGGPAVSANVIIVPSTLGGTADGNLAQATVQLPVVGTPVFAAAPGAVPVIVSALPSGAGAGAIVTIRGVGFTGTVPTTGVKFGGVNATSSSVTDDGTIVAVVPAGSAGSAPIIVTNATGASAAFPYTRA